MLDVREIDSDGSFEAGFDVLVSSLGSIVDLLHEPPGFDKVEFEFLASHFLIESFDCSSLVEVANILRVLADLDSVGFVDDGTETETMLLQSH